MAETDDTQPNDGDDGDDSDLGGVLGEVDLDYEDDDESVGGADSASDEADDGPFAPEPGMQLSKSFGTKLTPPEKEFIEKYVEFSDEYENPGVFLRAFVRELRKEHGEEVMRRKKALDELKGGL